MTNGLKKIGLTPAKAALVAVLALGLGVVWGPLLFGGSKDSVAEAKPAAPRARTPRQSRRAVATTSRNQAVPAARAIAETERSIPTLTLSEASIYDPFATPTWATSPNQLAEAGGQSTPSDASLQERFESLKASRVGMVLVSDGGQAAQIGDRTVRVGDEIDGFLVVEITQNNIVFQPAASGPGGKSGT